MAPATSSFDRWCELLESDSEGFDLSRRLQIAAERAGQEYGAHMWFAEILGRRWSYIAGASQENVLSGVIRRIPLERGIGLVLATWGTMKKAEQESFLKAVKRLISS